jgi:hypothetical protein
MTCIEFLVHTYVLFLTARQRVFWIFQPLQLWKLALSWIAKLWLMKFYTCWPKSRTFRHLSWDIWIYFSELLLLPTFTRKETTPQLLLATKCWAHNFIVSRLATRGIVCESGLVMIDPLDNHVPEFVASDPKLWDARNRLVEVYPSFNFIWLLGVHLLPCVWVCLARI